MTPPGSGPAPRPQNAAHRPRWQLMLGLWLGWYMALMLFQQVNWMRLDVQRPDNGYPWTAGLTTGSIDGPAEGAWFYARWDSYRYVEIAQRGYADPLLATFFPGYPLLMRVVDSLLLSPLMAETTGNHRMALAGLLVSALMSYLALVGMDTLARERLPLEGDAFRSSFYLLIFPTAFFMVQVYTEATYLALSLWALVFLYRGRWWLAAALALYATLTRPTGLFLIFPFATVWLDGWWRGQRPPWPTLLAVATPGLTFLLFNRYLALNGIDTIAAQENFGRYLLHPFALRAFIQQVGWLGLHPMGTIQVGIDLLLTLFALGLCLLEWNRHAGLALYGAAASLVSLTTGQLVSQNRYVLIVIPIYFVLARWGRHPVIDRVWTLLSLLLLALHLIQFTHVYWAG